MKKIFLFALSISLVSLTLNSCKKSSDDDDDSPSPSKSSLIVGTWMMTAATVTPPINFFGLPISDLYSFMDDCEKDDLIVINADKTYESNQGTLLCDSVGPFIMESGTWTWNTDETILTTTPTGGAKEEQKISNLNSKSFQVIETELDSATSTTYTYTITMTKQ